jgi:hypothetical protein
MKFCSSSCAVMAEPLIFTRWNFVSVAA